MMMNTETLWNLFKECDIDGSGYIGREEVRDICSKFSIPREGADTIFENLDRDGDGQISFEDFREGFKDYERGVETYGKLSITSNHNDSDMTSIDRARHSSNLKRVRSFTRKIDRALAAEEPMEPEKQAQMIEELMESLKKLKDDNEILAKSYMRERREHEEHLFRIEQDVDSQVRQVEARVTERAKQEIEAERRSLREMMKDEMNQLQAHLSMFDKVENWLKNSQSTMENEKLGEFRSKLEEALEENHQMRLSLLDTQTTVAMIRSELGQLKSLYEQRCKELNHEREKVLEVVHNQDYLTRQLFILQNSNQKLQDFTDSMQESDFASIWGPSSIVSNESSEGHNRTKKGSIVGDYLKPEPEKKRIVDGNANHLEHRTIREEELIPGAKSRTGQSDRSTDSPRASCHEDENDSGLSTITRDEQDELNYTSYCSLVSGSPTLREIDQRRSPLMSAPIIKDVTGIINDDQDDSLTSVQDGGVETESSPYWIPGIREVEGPGEVLYNLIFIGDMAVGKTALIYRLAVNQFLVNLCSTVGVDFHVKTLCVDNEKTITVQLWDTGGQERFRSITMSYFRKADGVILVYDVTLPQTFLNARNWINQIREFTDREIPVVLVGNKIDLRGSTNSGKEMVTHDTGYKLAQEFDCPFFEISAKQGINVTQALEAIIRKMMENDIKSGKNGSDPRTVVKLDEKSGFWAKKKCSTC